MAWVSINTARNAQDAPISQDWGNDVVNDLNYLFGNSSNTVDSEGAPIVPNGSFELDANNSTTVTGWTVVLGTGSTGIVTNSDQNHGAQSFKFTRDSTVGHNGGSLTSSFLNVSPSAAYQLQFMLKCSNSDVDNSVQITWYTATKSVISTVTLVDSGTSASAPTVWTQYCAHNIIPPATAMFAVIILNAGLAAETPASTRSILFDGVAMTPRTPFSSINDYTSSTTFTVPSGTYCLNVRIYAAGYGPGNNGGYAESTYPCQPGNSLVITISNTLSSSILAGGVNTANMNGNILSATNGGTRGSGTASSNFGGVVIPGGSALTVSHIVVAF